MNNVNLDLIWADLFLRFLLLGVAGLMFGWGLMALIDSFNYWKRYVPVGRTPTVLARYRLQATCPHYGDCDDDLCIYLCESVNDDQLLFMSHSFADKVAEYIQLAITEELLSEHANFAICVYVVSMSEQRQMGASR